MDIFNNNFLINKNNDINNIYKWNTQTLYLEDKKL